MLLGEYEHTIDDKNRLTLPAKFREELAGGVVVTRGVDGCLFVYSAEHWRERFQARLGELDQLQREGRKLQRHFFAGAGEAELDKQGRIMIPSALLRYAGLSRTSWSPVSPTTSRSGIERPGGGAQRGGRECEHVAERLAAQRD